MLGGGMRQVGSLAAAGIYALENNVSRLEEDHENTQLLADSLQNLAGFNIKEAPQTNMMMLDLIPGKFSKLKVMLADHDVTVSGQRWVCHKDISTDDIHKVINICQEFSKA